MVIRAGIITAAATAAISRLGGGTEPLSDRVRRHEPGPEDWGDWGDRPTKTAGSLSGYPAVARERGKEAWAVGRSSAADSTEGTGLGAFPRRSPRVCGGPSSRIPEGAPRGGRAVEDDLAGAGGHGQRNRHADHDLGVIAVGPGVGRAETAAVTFEAIVYSGLVVPSL